MTEKQHKTKIDEEYFIDSDAFSLLLQKKSIAQSGKNKGEEIYTTVAYQNRLEDILKNYFDIKVRESVKEAKDVKELINIIKDIKKHINNILEVENNE